MDWFSGVVPTLVKYPHGCPSEAAVPSGIPTPAKELVRTLCELGLWEGPPYKITATGKATLEIGIGLHCPKPLLTHPEDYEDIMKAPLAQLILRLERDGWTNYDLSTSRTENVRSMPGQT